MYQADLCNGYHIEVCCMDYGNVCIFRLCTYVSYWQILWLINPDFVTVSTFLLLMEL